MENIVIIIPEFDCLSSARHPFGFGSIATQTECMYPPKKGTDPQKWARKVAAAGNTDINNDRYGDNVHIEDTHTHTEKEKERRKESRKRDEPLRRLTRTPNRAKGSV